MPLPDDTRNLLHLVLQRQPVAAMSAKALPVVNPAQCTGCGRCVAACPPKVLWLQASHPKGWGPKVSTLHDAEACTGCAQCHVVCPFDAIRMVRVSVPRTPS